MRITKFKGIFVTLAAVLILPAALSAQQSDQAPAAKPNPHMESRVGDLTGQSGAGADLYYRYCWGCHGARGNGDGENTPYLNPTPRNFVAAVFKCRSTPTGTLPTDDDLYSSIWRGFYTTAMPSWITLTAQNRADLVAFIKTFSARWATDKAGEPIQVPSEPSLTVESIRRGKGVFQKMECWKCHGQEGRGDGPSAATLTDSFDQPIRPYNFAQGTRFKCGTTNQDLYKIFMTGLDGTPMPSFASVIKPEEAWDLVHYLRTLQVSHPSPELALWKTTPEGAAFLAAEKVRNTPTGSGLAP